MARPTDDAKGFFDEAERFIVNAGLRLHKIGLSADERQLADLDMWRGMWKMINGLSSLATGLRATYILLEEAKASVEKRK